MCAWPGASALPMRPAAAQLTQVFVMFSFIATKTLQMQESASSTSNQGTCVLNISNARPHTLQAPSSGGLSLGHKPNARHASCHNLSKLQGVA